MLKKDFGAAKFEKLVHFSTFYWNLAHSSHFLVNFSIFSATLKKYCAEMVLTSRPGADKAYVRKFLTRDFHLRPANTTEYFEHRDSSANSTKLLIFALFD